MIEFRTGRIFDADDTGELVDIGGWLRVEAVDDTESKASPEPEQTTPPPALEGQDA
jgi:hypothetical protein